MKVKPFRVRSKVACILVHETPRLMEQGCNESQGTRGHRTSELGIFVNKLRFAIDFQSSPRGKAHFGIRDIWLADVWCRLPRFVLRDIPRETVINKSRHRCLTLNELSSKQTSTK